MGRASLAPVDLVASTAAEAPLTVPHGTAPSAPVNGDVWTTSAGIFVRINGVTIGPLASSAGSSPTFVEYEANLGTLPVYSGTFQITGLAGLTTGKQVDIVQKATTYTGKDTVNSDEIEMDLLTASGYVLNATTIQVYWTANPGPVAGNIKFGYQISL